VCCLFRFSPPDRASRLPRRLATVKVLAYAVLDSVVGSAERDPWFPRDDNETPAPRALPVILAALAYYLASTQARPARFSRRALIIRSSLKHPSRLALLLW